MITLINTIRLGSQTFLRSTPKQVSLNNWLFNSLLDLPVTFHKKIKSSGYGS